MSTGSNDLNRKQELADEPGKHERSESADRYPDQSHTHAMCEHQTQHIGRTAPMAMRMPNSLVL